MLNLGSLSNYCINIYLKLTNQKVIATNSKIYNYNNSKKIRELLRLFTIARVVAEKKIK